MPPLFGSHASRGRSFPSLPLANFRPGVVGRMAVLCVLEGASGGIETRRPSLPMPARNHFLVLQFMSSRPNTITEFTTHGTTNTLQANISSTPALPTTSRHLAPL